MKRCPTCEKTFEDSMRFCQSDGTPLVEDAPPMDPYKTMVARPEDLAGSAAPQKLENEEDFQPSDEVSDPLKTMYASEDEVRREMEALESDKEPVLEPDTRGSEYPSDSRFGKSTPPLASVNDPKLSAYDPPTPNFQQYAEPSGNADVFDPFDQASLPAEWSPSPAPESSWQNQDLGRNAPFQTPSGGAVNQNQTLAIVSLVLGILGIVICFGLTSPFALITGFMARKKALQYPNEYEGGGIALGGIITGAIGTVMLLLFALILFAWFGIVGLSILGS